MIRILQVVNIMDRAGIENMLMNYYRVIDRSKVQFDFLTHRPVEGAYDKEIFELGGQVYHAPRLYPQNYPAYFRFMKQFFLKHSEYNIVHSHIESMSYLPLLCAKKAGVPIRIVHSHNISIDLNYKYPLKQLFKQLIPLVATDYAACSRSAGEYLFPRRKFTVIPNAINIEKFVFNEETRKSMRRKLGIEGKYVIGHVGRFTRQKNHEFLIDTFSQVIKKRDDAFLLLIGAGEYKEKFEWQIKKYSLDNKVLILSNRDDIENLYQVMDIFVLPSLYEGLGMAAVEAQVSGLKCLISDKVPEEALISPDTLRLPLRIDNWVENISEYREKGARHPVYSEYYDVQKASDRLVQYYSLLNEKI